MADGQCDWGGTPHGRNWILTRLSPPATIELCDEHIAPGMIPLLAAELGADPTAFYEAVERFVKREAAKAAKDLAAAESLPDDQAEPTEPDTGAFHGPLPELPAKFAGAGDGTSLTEAEPAP